MKRDMELVRDLMMKISEADRPLDFEDVLQLGNDEQTRAVAA